MSCVPAAAVFVFVGFASSTARAESYVFDARRTEVRFAYLMGRSRKAVSAK